MQNKSCIYKNRIGKAGELIAKDFMINEGYEFIKNNYRYDRAEADLIFSRGEGKYAEIIFAEVKTRRSKKFGEGEESVDAKKQAQIRKAAEGFLLENECYRNYQVRLDVIVVYLIRNEKNIVHIPNAFY
ncbi:MAG: YraN family protein [Ignavibacteria bacterium]|nr:YraN family protein [Ignavibacteria bacterium]